MATKSGAGNLVYSVVAIAIIVLIVSTVAVPVIDDAQGQIRLNNSTQVFAVSDADVTINVQLSNDSKPIVNGYLVPGNTHKPIVICDEFMIHWRSSGALYLIDSNATSLNLQSAIIENGTVTYTLLDSTTGTISYGSNNVLFASEHGTYGEFTAGTKFYANPDSVIYSYLDAIPLTNEDLTPSSVSNIRAVFIGTPTGMDGYLLQGTTGIITATPATVDVGDYYEVTVSETSVSYTDAVGTYTGTSNRAFFAPIQYGSSMFDNLFDLLGVIPILLFLVPVMFAVRMIQTRRN